MIKVNVKHIFVVAFSLLFSVFCTYAQQRNFKVVLDAGHGGKDPGALGSSSREKDIVLPVALKVGRLIEKNNKDVEVVYTRNTDVFIPLDQRAIIANRAKANLFISFHCNSVENRKKGSPQGAETYILGLHRSKDNMDVARKENSVILLEDNYSRTYQGFNPNEPESYIIFEFMSSQYLQQSLHLASLVQRRMEGDSNRANRGVRQGGFLVLREVAMPSILIELGYISNATDEKYLKSEAGQTSLANSIYKAFSEYKRDFDKKSVVFMETPSERQKKNVPEDDILENDSDRTAMPADTREYRIQFLSSSTRLKESSSAFKGLSPVSYYKDGNLYKYTYGSSTDQRSILRLLKEVQAKFSDAFVIEMKDGKRIK